MIVPGNFDIVIDISKAGYSPFAIVGFNLGDRGVGEFIVVTGYLIEYSTGHIYGRNNSSNNIGLASPSVSALYYYN